MIAVNTFVAAAAARARLSVITLCARVIHQSVVLARAQSTQLSTILSIRPQCVCLAHTHKQIDSSGEAGAVCVCVVSDKKKKKNKKKKIACWSIDGRTNDDEEEDSALIDA